MTCHEDNEDVLRALKVRSLELGPSCFLTLDIFRAKWVGSCCTRFPMSRDVGSRIFDNRLLDDISVLWDISTILSLSSGESFWFLADFVAHWALKKARQVDSWDNQSRNFRLPHRGLLQGLFTGFFVRVDRILSQPIKVINQYSAAMPSHRPLVLCWFKCKVMSLCH